MLYYSGVGQLGVPVGLITRRSMVQIHPPLFLLLEIMENLYVI